MRSKGSSGTLCVRVGIVLALIGNIAILVRNLLGAELHAPAAPTEPVVAGLPPSPKVPASIAAASAPARKVSLADARKQETSQQQTPKKEDYELVWEARGGGSSFKRHGSEDWVEVTGNVVKFHFKEEKLVKHGPDTLVQLHDTTRNMHMRIVGAKLSFKYGDTEEWTFLYTGRWTLIDGEEQDDPPPPPYPFDKMPPPPQHSKKNNPEVKIIVLLAAYRDPMCGNTLHEVFLHAEQPDRVMIGIVEQYQDGDPSCVELYCELQHGGLCRREQIKIHKVPLSKSRGVMPARYRQHLLIDDEEFCLQIDSHSAFEDNWDTLALNDWLLAQNEMAVMSTYPNRVTQRHLQYSSPARCSTMWGGGVVLGGVSATNAHNPTGRPYLVPFFGAGVAFSKCHAMLNVPYDPYMPYLFKGEEFNRAIRLFTHGYDVYAPYSNYVYHYYDDDPKPVEFRKFGPRTRAFLSGDYSLDRQSRLRWRAVLGLRPDAQLLMDDNMESFGLGKRRTLSQFETFAKVSLSRETADSQCHLLGKLKWVPYEYEDDPTEPSKRFRPSGPSCPAGQTSKCCTNFARSKSSVGKMLDLTNSEFGREIRSRTPKDRPQEPVFDADDAPLGPCDAGATV